MCVRLRVNLWRKITRGSSPVVASTKPFVQDSIPCFKFSPNAVDLY